jgi:glycosyltransferase involved in cell wall biosynthesis
MHIAYAIAARLGGSGIGNIASRAVRAIGRANLGLTAFAFSNVMNDLPSQNFIPIFRLPRILPIEKKRFKFLRAKLFDLSLSKHIARLAPSIFHGWNGHCLRSLKTARNTGAVTVVERASTHIRTQVQLLTEEFERFGITDRVEIPAVISRYEEECDFADYVTVPSQFAFDSFLAQGFTPEKLLLVHFGVDTDRFSPRPRELREEFRVLFIGRIGLRKGVQYLLKAWNKLKLKNASLELVGHIEPTFRKVLSNFAAVGNLRIPGFVGNPSEKFAEADVFVFPSIEEGSALVTYEALASGLPVITTPNSGSVVRDGVDGFIVRARDTDALTEKIEHLYQNREALREMSIQARNRALQFTWDSYGENLISAYKKILGGRIAAK